MGSFLGWASLWVYNLSRLGDAAVHLAPVTTCTTATLATVAIHAEMIGIISIIPTATNRAIVAAI